ncbi:MAG: hypothetical protein F6K52_04240 [Moorea sp. SIO3H5]|nr:hypothetical protein [Moorena sp. SIO3H5]
MPTLTVRYGTMLLAKYFVNIPRSPISPHPQPLSQPWERGADYGRIRVSRIRQQHPSLTHPTRLCSLFPVPCSLFPVPDCLSTFI